MNTGDKIDTDVEKSFKVKENALVFVNLFHVSLLWVAHKGWVDPESFESSCITELHSWTMHNITFM